MKIPIRNLYYLLCYAWDVLPESHVVDVGIEDAVSGGDLLAHVLINGVSNLRRRGLMRAYTTREEAIAGVRGKFHLAQTLKQHLMIHGRAYCGFDELDVDALPNQIVKATLRLLATTDSVAPRLRNKLAGLFHSLGGVSDLELSVSVFTRVQLHRHIYFYRLLLNICRLAFDNSLPKEVGAQSAFRDFVRDERQMRVLFQKFVLNFLRREQAEYTVESPQVNWQVRTDDPDALQWLPKMQTDVVLRSATRTAIIDTKFYVEAFQSRFGRDKIRSEHLYQIMSYAMNWNATSRPEGILLYPTVRQHFDFRYSLSGIPIRVCSLDLDQPWNDIHSSLLKYCS